MPFISSVTPPSKRPDQFYALLFRNNQLLILHTNDSPRVPISSPTTETPFEAQASLFLGHLDSIACYAGELSEEESIPDGYEFLELRSLFAELNAEFNTLIAHASQIITWDKDHQFCSRCGKAAFPKAGERAKGCHSCGLLTFPRISPAIIVAITRGDEILLARSSHFRPGVFSVLAGFVEPGETLEQCVQREVMEEVGIQVNNIRYFGNQPWPFPHSLMIGFTADYAGGEITIDDEEIIEAGWYKPASMPGLPGKSSIAMRLIEQFLSEAE